MTLDELKVKYEFLKDMQAEEIKKLVMFLMLTLLEISLGKGKDNLRVEEFTRDVSNALKSK